MVTKQIEFAVIVEVRPDRGEAVALLRIGDAGLLRDIGEGSVAVVVVEIVGRALEAARAALHLDSLVFAGVFGAEGGHVVEVEVDVMGNEEVGPAVAVVVAEGSAGGPLRVAGEAGGFGHVGECAVAIVAIQTPRRRNR